TLGVRLRIAERHVATGKVQGEQTVMRAGLSRERGGFGDDGVTGDRANFKQLLPRCAVPRKQLLGVLRVVEADCARGQVETDGQVRFIAPAEVVNKTTTRHYAISV